MSTKVKICGLMTQEIVDATVQAKADYLGFVFAPSKRKVTPEHVREITINVPNTVKKVGVFVSPTLEELVRTIEIAQLDFVQIHGENRLTANDELPVPLIQALNGQSQTLANQLLASQTDQILLDAPATNQTYAGGNGQTFDWLSLSKQVRQQLQTKQLWIAGGLTPKNVQEAITFFQPYAVDVSSAVETNGAKDIQKIHAFIKAVKEQTDVSNTR